MTVGSTLVGAFALPAFALGPTAVDNSHAGQTVVAADSETIISKDNFKALTAAQAARAGLTISYPSYKGPSVADYLKNPPYASDYDLAAVFAVAKKYIGVPYRYGGASPPDLTAPATSNSFTPNSVSRCRTVPAVKAHSENPFTSKTHGPAILS